VMMLLGRLGRDAMLMLSHASAALSSHADDDAATQGCTDCGKVTQPLC
jgi:hypothetical protein